MARLEEESPAHFASRLADAGVWRAWLVWEPGRGGYAASHPLLDELAAALLESPDCAGHEAVFFQRARSHEALLSAFLHKTVRGQAQGGLRRRPYERLGDLLRDGLRLSRAMTRKSALAGLWWGGGKGLIADRSDDPARRAALYAEYGAFVSSLRGCYVTAEDVGTSPADMAAVFSRTRFATCIPPEAGGSGNPARATASGVLLAMQAALEFRGLGGLEGRRVAIQGVGQVGGELAALLLEAGARVVASEVRAESRDLLLERCGSDALEVRLVQPGDGSILAEPCDVLAPCGLGAVLDPKTIPGLRAAIVCGAANNPLADEERDARALTSRGITYVPDFVANRMGIVQCANEQYGSPGADDAVLRHLDRDEPGGVYATTRRVLERARSRGVSSTAAAAQLADEMAEVPHPIWGHRGWRIVQSLVAEHWERGTPPRSG